MAQIQFIVGIVFAILFLYCLLNYKSRLASYLSLFCLGIAIYSIGYGLEISSTTVGKFEFAMILETPCLIIITPIWLLIAYEYYFNNSSFFTKFVILSIPILFIFIFVMNPYHHLYYSYKINENGTYSMVEGPLCIIEIIFNFLVYLLGQIMFFKLWKRASFSVKTPAFLMFIGSFFPIMAHLVYLLKIGPVPYDLTSFGLVVFVFTFLLALMKYDFLELREIAREHVFDVVKEGFIIIDNKFRLIDFNPAAQKYFQWLTPLNIGKNVDMFAAERMICEHTTEQFNIKINLNGKMRLIGFLATPLMKQHKQAGEILILQDITEQTALLEELERLATYDALSGVYNRRKLLEVGEKEFDIAQRSQTILSSLMIDIDHFKQINDRYGHLAGDKTIATVAAECKKRIWKTGIIGRYGGEEFLLFLPDTDLNKALFIADDIRKLIEEMVIEFDNQKIQVKISIGVSSTSCKSKSLTELINESDIALYKAKATGRNRVCPYGSGYPETVNV